MKSKKYIILGFGIPMAICYIVFEFIFNPAPKTSREIVILIASGILFGILGGFLYAWITVKFMVSKFVAETTLAEFQHDETIQFESPANHIKNGEGVGGKLYLTNKRLIFKSHKLNIQSHEYSIPLSNIDGVQTGKTLGLLNNRITISANNRIEKFIVNKPGDWLNRLKRQ